MKKLIALLGIVTVLLLVACGSKSVENSEPHADMDAVTNEKLVKVPAAETVDLYDVTAEDDLETDLGLGLDDVEI